MNRLLSILFLAFFLGELCTHAQQATATLTPTQPGPGGVPYRTAAFGTIQGGGFQNTATVNWELRYTNLPANATVVATVNVTYQPRQGNTHVQTFSFTGAVNGLQGTRPGNSATGTMNGANPPPFDIIFNRNLNGAPVASQGLVCGTYTLSVAFTVNGQAGNAPQPETGNVEFLRGGGGGGGTNNYTGQQWGTNIFNPGTATNMGRGNVVVLKRVYNARRGTVQVIKNGIIHRNGFLNFQLGNPRQALRNYRRH